MDATAASRSTADTSADRDLASARRVLEVEGHGLAALAGSLGDEFVRALDVFAATSGRVIVTGMGKSGHIGRKIAATLASTGTPSFYVHPGEASHGDLGMIAQGDAVFALSNSGETPELADIVAYAKRFEVPLVGVTASRASTLARAVDVALILPDAAEACPMGLAPTTSTTVMLALGDAIAVALLERKGFSVDDFQILHPGGKLGRRLLKVADLMHTGDELPLVAGDCVMSEALLEMTAKHFGCLGIVDSAGELIGIITDGDLRRNMRTDLLELTAAEIMTQGAKTLNSRLHAGEALKFMNDRNITNVFVVDDRRPVGILHIHDCLRAGVA